MVQGKLGGKQGPDSLEGVQKGSYEHPFNRMVRRQHFCIGKKFSFYIGRVAFVRIQKIFLPEKKNSQFNQLKVFACVPSLCPGSLLRRRKREMWTVVCTVNTEIK